MRLMSIYNAEEEVAAIQVNEGIITLDLINKAFNKNWEIKLFSLLNVDNLRELKKWLKENEKDIIEKLLDKIIPLEKVNYAPLYRRPRKIWGIGLNYSDHAADLSEKKPETEPASFMKPDTTIIGHKENINIPVQSNKTTAEAELGIIIGKKCRNIKKENWLDYVAGFTSIIDMTAEDILRKNPRYLTRAKSFDTFFSFGPQLLTVDEVENVLNLKVATVINGKIFAQNTISNMTFPPDYLVAFHSRVMTLLPGDIISTGTPRAVHINDGDVAECWIDGFEKLINPVIDLKKHNSL